MPVRIEWDNPEQTIIHVMFENIWDITDVNRMIGVVIGLIKSVDHPVDTIYDFTTSRCSPTNLLLALGRMEFSHNEKQRLLVIVKANNYIKTLCLISRKLASKTFGNQVFVNSLNEAHDHIAAQSHPLPA